MVMLTGCTLTGTVEFTADTAHVDLVVTQLAPRKIETSDGGHYFDGSPFCSGSFIAGIIPEQLPAPDDLESCRLKGAVPLSAMRTHVIRTPEPAEEPTQEPAQIEPTPTALPERDDPSAWAPH